MNIQKTLAKPSRFYVYTLYFPKDSKLYTGFSEDLKERITQHAKGLVKSTKHRLPFTLIHYEYFINQEDAKARERFLKSGFGRQQLKESLKRTLKKLI